ncbi:hypothetical protein RYX36_036451 [Vicia faba]
MSVSKAVRSFMGARTDRSSSIILTNVLESLDIRHYFNVNLAGSLEKRCKEQINGYVFHSSAIPLSSSSYFVCVLNRSYNHNFSIHQLSSFLPLPQNGNGRRWTRSRNYYVAKPEVDQREVEDDVDFSGKNPCFVYKLDVFDTDPGDHKVRVCREKTNDHVFTMKKLKKLEMLRRGQVEHVKAERNVLAEVDSNCIVKLYCSFQDDEYLYLIMEYLLGGDMMTLLMRKDTLTKDEARFYVGETVLAIESIHWMSFIMREMIKNN